MVNYKKLWIPVSGVELAFQTDVVQVLLHGHDRAVCA